MVDRPFDHEEAEFAFVRARELIARLPETTESKRAKANLDTAEQYVHEALERIKPAPAESE